MNSAGEVVHGGSFRQPAKASPTGLQGARSGQAISSKLPPTRGGDQKQPMTRSSLLRGKTTAVMCSTVALLSVLVSVAKESTTKMCCIAADISRVSCRLSDP